MKLRTGLKTMIGLTLVRVGSQEYSELTVHATAIPTARGLPVKETWRIGTEVSVLGIAVLAMVVVLCLLILRQRRLSLFGVEVPPRALGLGVLLAAVVAMVLTAVASFSETVFPLRLKTFEALDR